MSKASPSRSKALAAALTALLFAGVIVGGALLYRRSGAPTPRPKAGDVLVSETLPLDPVGSSRRFRVRVPSTLEFAASLPAGVRVRFSFGVPGPVEASPVDVPAADTAASWTASAGEAPHREVVLAPGLYVLRATPEAADSKGSATLEVRARPPR